MVPTHALSCLRQCKTVSYLSLKIPSNTMSAASEQRMWWYKLLVTIAGVSILQGQLVTLSLVIPASVNVSLWSPAITNSCCSVENWCKSFSGKEERNQNRHPSLPLETYALLFFYQQENFYPSQHIVGFASRLQKSPLRVSKDCDF